MDEKMSRQNVSDRASLVGLRAGMNLSWRMGARSRVPDTMTVPHEPTKRFNLLEPTKHYRTHNVHPLKRSLTIILHPRERNQPLVVLHVKSGEADASPFLCLGYYRKVLPWTESR
jgi:hypothetical protein